MIQIIDCTPSKCHLNNYQFTHRKFRDLPVGFCQIGASFVPHLIRDYIISHLPMDNLCIFSQPQMLKYLQPSQLIKL